MQINGKETKKLKISFLNKLGNIPMIELMEYKNKTLLYKR